MGLPNLPPQGEGAKTDKKLPKNFSWKIFSGQTRGCPTGTLFPFPPKATHTMQKRTSSTVEECKQAQMEKELSVTSRPRPRKRKHQTKK
jgi:hypothetical protein